MLQTSKMEETFITGIKETAAILYLFPFHDNSAPAWRLHSEIRSPKHPLTTPNIRLTREEVLVVPIRRVLIKVPPAGLVTDEQKIIVRGPHWLHDTHSFTPCYLKNQSTEMSNFF